MIIRFDLDGIIAEDTGGWSPEEYADAKPNKKTIALMRRCVDEGIVVIIYTSRLSEETFAITLDWLTKNKVPYSQIHFDKPFYTYCLDDRNITLEQLEEILDKR